MAGSPPQRLTPRIVDPVEPGPDGFHVIHVIMPTALATGYPDKPWGTKISELQIFTTEAEKYKDYQLVDIESSKGTPDLIWVFQKLDGPTLEGRTNYVQRTKGLYSEQDVQPGTEADSGLLIVESSVMPDGLGKSVKKTVQVESWPEHVGSEWDVRLRAQVKTVEQFVEPPVTPDVVDEDNPDPFAEPNVSYEIVNDDRSLKKTKIVPTDALNNYLLRYPVRIDMDLPKVLKSVSVVWNTQFSIGTQDTMAFDSASGTSGSVALSIPDTASSSAAITAELNVTFEDFATNNIFADQVVFYMEGPINNATILDRLSELFTEGSDPPVTIEMWPVFKPQSSTIIVTGQSIKVSANVSVSLNESWSPTSNSLGWSKTTSDDYGIQISNNAAQLPPCIHPEITITGGVARSQAVSATAVMWITSSNGNGVSATKTKAGTAYGVVTPAIIPAVDGEQSIPNDGLYLYNMAVGDTDYDNWFMVKAIVFDASIFA